MSTGTTELLEHGYQSSLDPFYGRFPNGIKARIVKRVPILAQAAGDGGAHPLKERKERKKGGGREREVLKRQLSIVSLFSICFSKYILTRALTLRICASSALSPPSTKWL
jgi:hypothetical protein